MIKAISLFTLEQIKFTQKHLGLVLIRKSLRKTALVGFLFAEFVISALEVENMNKVPMTVRGEKLLRDELDVLLKRRPVISKAIGEARELGDLKENAEYHAAREEQGICEAQIRDIEYKLSMAQVIDVTKMTNTGKVIFGATVMLIDVNTDDEVKYQIVADDEASIKEGRISVNSPIARGLIGKMEGDEVNIQTPGGTKEFEIEKVEYI